ncbi:general secretion pathway protein L [Hyphomicrobium facile]|uniref:General secretion pathway protein L n=2 Tax=Hyphomicrobium facile TaxID=51670 RepID=A0A1I7NRR0_9HYPH|nr:general secretion pathway protein L [Hyphomicrobium facile]
MKMEAVNRGRIREAYSWWLRELSKLLTPKRMSERPWRTMLFHTPAGLEILTKTGSQITNLGVLRSDASAEEIAAIRRSLLQRAAQESKQVLLRLSPTDVVRRTIQVPKAAADLMDSVVENKIETIVAWPQEDTRYSYRVIGADPGSPTQINTEIVATTKKIVDTALDAARTVGLSPGAVDFAPAPDAASIVELAHLEADPVSKMAGRLHVGLCALALCSVAICMFGIYQLSDLNDQYGDMESKIIGVTSRVDEVKRLNDENTKLKDQRERLAKQKIDFPPVMTLIEALSRSLPDTAYLDEFEIHDNEARIVGKSADPTGLIGLLESTPEFEDVRFAAPTTREDGQTLGTFSIVAKLRGVAHTESSQ